MIVKLNLSVNEKTAAKAKIFAAKNNTSVSKLVDEYLDKITSKPPIKKGQSFVEKYAGILKHPILDIDAERDEYLKEKYGL